MGVALHQPETVEDAVRLAGQEVDARFLAGGQTLVAMMNSELIEPAALISLDRIASLKGIRINGDGSVHIGAMTRHAQIAESKDLTGVHAIVRDAAQVIAHPAIRNLGTIGGAVSHGDPNADFPAALVAADATFQVRGGDGEREIAASAFFQDYLTTDLKDGELVTGVTLPKSPDSGRGHYEKFARADGDYATVSVAVALAMTAADKVDWIRIVVGACGPAPVRVAEAEDALAGGDLDAAAVAQAADKIAAACDPLDDVRGSTDYRRLLVPRLIAKAVAATRTRTGD
ncbi:MAG: xanthine dehydrogenase family protein subunit M [Alphaproteobacteria bacterium]|nr:xanthine dehydrogenase family protein subunit M [Alphaproteobacteria bacterium]